MIGIEAAFLIGGLIVTETVFNIPGVARFLVEAIRWRDYPMVQNLVMFIAIIVVTINFIVDMLYAALDPRIKYSALEASSICDGRAHVSTHRLQRRTVGSRRQCRQPLERGRVSSSAAIRSARSAR